MVLHRWIDTCVLPYMVILKGQSISGTIEIIVYQNIKCVIHIFKIMYYKYKIYQNIIRWYMLLRIDLWYVVVYVMQIIF